MKQFNLFPTLVMEFDLNPKINTQLLYNELKKVDAKEHPLLEGAGKSTYERTDGGLLDLDVPLIKALKTELQNCVDVYAQKTALVKTVITNSWCSTMNKGSSLVFHRHEASVISGAYYPKVPEGSIGLTFESPIEMYKMAEVHNDITEYNMKDVTVPATEGYLYLFPSWLKHGSRMNTTDNRMVVSFNTLNIL